MVSLPQSFTEESVFLAHKSYFGLLLQGVKPSQGGSNKGGASRNDKSGTISQRGFQSFPAVQASLCWERRAGYHGLKLTSLQLFKLTVKLVENSKVGKRDVIFPNSSRDTWTEFEEHTTQWSFFPNFFFFSHLSTGIVAAHSSGLSPRPCPAALKAKRWPVSKTCVSFTYSPPKAVSLPTLIPSPKD